MTLTVGSEVVWKDWILCWKRNLGWMMKVRYAKTVPDLGLVVKLVFFKQLGLDIRINRSLGAIIIFNFHFLKACDNNSYYTGALLDAHE